MIVVILAGGAGTRLWPLSTPDFPKHLLSIDGDENSVLQNSYLRAKRLTSKIYVVPDASHADHVRKQLPMLDSDHLLVEPARRGTASCILAALVKIGKLDDHNEPVAFIHADHFIRDVNGFVDTFKIATDLALTQGRITLIGVEPNYPSTGFGYIKKGRSLNQQTKVYDVDGFKEKPKLKTALGYLKSDNYLWNCGYFVGSVNIFKDAMQKFAPELYSSYLKLTKTNSKNFNDAYLSLPNLAIDYALIEKVKNLLVVPAGFDWLDLGSFNDLAKVVRVDQNGNYNKGKVVIDSVKNSYVENHEDKPLVVIGLEGVVVINTKKGILVTKKDLSQKVGEIAKQLKEDDKS